MAINSSLIPLQGPSDQYDKNEHLLLTYLFFISTGNACCFPFRYSSYIKLLHITHCLRFINNIRAKHNSGKISNQSSKSLIVLELAIINEYFSKKIRFLEKNKAINRQNSLVCLNLFINKFELIRTKVPNACSYG